MGKLKFPYKRLSPGYNTSEVITVKREKVSAFFKSKGFYVSLFAGIFAVFVLTMVYANVNSIKRQSEDELAKQDTPGNLAEVNPAGEGAIGVKPDATGGQKDTSTGSETAKADGETAKNSDITGSATPDGWTGETAQGDAADKTPQNEMAQGEKLQEDKTQGEVAANDTAKDDAGEGTSTETVAKEDQPGLAEGETSSGIGEDLAGNLELESEYGEVASAEGETDTAEPVTSVQPNQNILQNLHFQEENGLLWPAEGAIIKNYSMEKLVYFETLEQFKCNPAVMISPEVGSDVVCGAKGVVTAITETEELGNSVLIDIGDGYQLRYAQIKDLHVQVGDVVEEGTVLAQVAEPTIYYSKEGSNLYFQVMQNGESVNPLLLLR